MTRREWLVHGLHENICIVRRFDIREDETGRLVQPFLAAHHIDEWFRGWHYDDVFARRMLYDIVDAMEGPLLDGSRIQTRWLKQRVEEMLRNGRMVAVRIPRVTHPIPAPADEQPETRREPPA